MLPGLARATFAVHERLGAVESVCVVPGPLAGQSKALAEAVSPDGSRLFVTGIQGYDPQFGSRSWGTIAYSTATGARLWLRGYRGSGKFADNGATAIAVNRAGTMVFVSGYIINADAVREDATVAYSAATGATLWVRMYRDAQAPTAVVLSPDGSTLFVETGDYRTLAYNATTGHQRWVSSVTGLRKDSSATALAVSPDGLRLFVTGQSANNGRPWTYQTAAHDAAAGTLLWAVHPRPLAPNGATGESLAVSPDGSTVYTAGFVPAAPGGAVIAYRSATGATLWRDNDLAGNLFRLRLTASAEGTDG